MLQWAYHPSTPQPQAYQAMIALPWHAQFMRSSAPPAVHCASVLHSPHDCWFSQSFAACSIGMEVKTLQHSPLLGHHLRVPDTIDPRIFKERQGDSQERESLPKQWGMVTMMKLPCPSAPPHHLLPRARSKRIRCAMPPKKQQSHLSHQCSVQHSPQPVT